MPKDFKYFKYDARGSNLVTTIITHHMRQSARA